jgi:hypothetical protein
MINFISLFSSIYMSHLVSYVLPRVSCQMPNENPGPHATLLVTRRLGLFATCSFRWFVVTESTVRWFIVRKKNTVGWLLILLICSNEQGVDWWLKKLAWPDMNPGRPFLDMSAGSLTKQVSAVCTYCMQYTTWSLVIENSNKVKPVEVESCTQSPEHLIM